MSVDDRVSRTTLGFIDDHRGQLMLHAGGVASPDGQTILLHGHSGAGKTTLTAALTVTGGAYLSDETICLDPQTLAIEPFRKPLTVKPGSQSVLRQFRPAKRDRDATSGNWQVPPDSFGGAQLPDAPLLPALIIFPRYGADQGEPTLTPVSRATAAFWLGENSSALWAIEPRPLAALERLVTAAPAFEASYNDAFSAAPVVHAKLSELAGNSLSPASIAASKPPSSATYADRLRPAAGVDWIELDDEALLFDGSHLHLLDRSGFAVWRLLDGRRDVPAIAALLAAEFNIDAADIIVDVDDLIRVLRTSKLVDG